jgi:hypothetical protein
MYTRLLLTLLLCLLPTLAHAQWTNEPAGSMQVLDCNFSSTPGACGISDVYSSTFRDSDASAPISPSGVMRSTIFAGNNYGGSQLNYVTPQVHNEMYVGMMWRTNPEFLGRTVANKLWFMRGPTTNHFFGMNGCPGQGQPNCYIEFGHNTGSLDNSHACAADLGLICHANVGNPTVIRGAWTKLESYMKKSTTATSRDGIVRWWINGVLVGNYTNLNVSPLGINEWVWSETWDGFVNPVPSVNWSHYLDHLHISIPNCTTCGGTSIDVPAGAPGVVTGVTATVSGVQ